MDVKQHQRFLIPDKSYASIAKREVTRIAEGIGMSANGVGKLNIVVAEMASNLAKHAVLGGELLVRVLGAPHPGIEVICLDSGPGMADPSKMQEDGVSTLGTAGEGLGAIKRQSDVFDLYSQQGVGTVILSRIYLNNKSTAGAQAASHHYDVGYVLVPKPKETLCGDGLAILEHEKGVYLLALDGLGHGASAHEASQLAVQFFTSSPALLPADALRNIHQSIKRTRGAVGIAANISTRSNRLSYCGIGNIAGKLYGPDGSYGSSSYKNIISYNGILGHNIPTTLNSQELEWGHHRMLILHSDGLKSRWDLSRYHALNRHLPSTVAALLYKDHSRQTDDALVVVCRSKP